MTEQLNKLDDRIISIDALRGLAMFLIISIDIGGAPIFQTFTELWGEHFANAASKQFNYGFVEGLKLCFIAMPMFLFIVGLVIPYSIDKKKLHKHVNKREIYLNIIKRSLILFLLGLIAGGPLLHLEFAKMPIYNNVLEYIAVGYLVCTVLVWNTSAKFQFILTLVLLVLYWAIFLFIHVPGWHGELYSEQMNLGIYVDNIVLGPFHQHGSCRILATISLIANMLLGVLMGKIIVSNRNKADKTKLLFLYGLIMLVAGIVWGQFFPVIRALWTSSFVLITCGISTLLLASFYLIIDVCGYSKWTFFFVIFGVNSIAVYMMAHMFDFRLIGNIFVGGLRKFLPPNIQGFIEASAAMTVIWLIMFCMYRKKIFIKI